MPSKILHQVSDIRIGERFIIVTESRDKLIVRINKDDTVMINGNQIIVGDSLECILIFDISSRTFLSRSNNRSATLAKTPTIETFTQFIEKYLDHDYQIKL